LLTSIFSVSDCSSPAIYCQPATVADFIYCSSLGGALTPTYSSCFVYLELSWVLAPPLFSSVESYQPVTVAGLVYLEFVQGSAFPPLSSGASSMSATVASLPYPPSLAGLFIHSSLGWLPCPLSLELKVPHPLCYKFLIIQFFLCVCVCGFFC
jgi:hypothetical protein